MEQNTHSLDLTKFSGDTNGYKHELKEPHPCFKWRDGTNTREVQSKPRIHVENLNTFSFPFIKTDTVQLISHMVYTIAHRGNVLQSEAIGNNGSEESDVTTDCPFPTMCPSTVRCRRGDGTIAPLSQYPQIGCGHLRLPLSIHRDTWVVCGLPKPTSTSSTKALCDTGVALSTRSILVCSGS